ncbi:MAG: alanine:cation symporter family protein [Sandaracinus sp.]
MESMLSLRDAVWSWAGLPAIVLAAFVVTVVLRFPQVTRLADAFRAVNAPDPRAEGSVHPATALALSAAASIGAGAVVSAATAVGLGGPGALAWLWLFGLLFAPIRLAEALLARTSPPGKAGQRVKEKEKEKKKDKAKGKAKADEAAPEKDHGIVAGTSGSLAGRLAADATPWVSALGQALFVLIPIAAIAIVGGLHGTAVAEAAEQLLPGSALPIGLGVAVVAAALAVFGQGKPWLGWLALVSLVVLVSACVVAILYDVERAFGMLGATLEDAFDGAPQARQFSGALVGEIAAAALGGLLPVFAGPTGIDGAISSLARARSTKAQAAAAMLPVLAHVLVATMVGLAIGATATHARAVEGTRGLDEMHFYDSAFETTSQRLEPERVWHGLIRVIDGTAQATPLQMGTERGMVQEPHFEEEDGSPGDFAMRIEDGRVTALLRRDDDGALAEVASDQIRHVVVRGRMLPARGALFAAAMTRGGGDVAGRAALAALMLLAALGAAAFGLALGRMFRERTTETNARLISVLPAVGLGLGATALGATLSVAGGIAAALVTLVVAIAVVARVREVMA